MFDYMSVKETAEKWGLSERRVQILCSNNRIQGVIRINRMWLIQKTQKSPLIDDIFLNVKRTVLKNETYIFC